MLRKGVSVTNSIEPLHSADSGAGSAMRPIFVGGCERSGTTMLGAMLGGHSRCLCVPETQFIDDLLAQADLGRSVDPRTALTRIVAHERYRLFWNLSLDPSSVDPVELGSTYGEVLIWLVRAFGRKAGKSTPDLWIDHTPTNFRRARTLLRTFPEARFIHLVRDGRAVAASLLPLDWGPNNALHAAEFWMARCAPGLATELDLGGSRVLRVRYEDVLQEPEGSLRRIALFAGVEYEPDMVTGKSHRASRYHERQHRLVGNPPDVSRAAGWQQVLTRRQIEMFEAEAGEFLETLGYQPRYGLRALPATRIEVLRLRLHDLARRAQNNLHRRWRASVSLR
jgi:sulfotransferase family protein